MSLPPLSFKTLLLLGTLCPTTIAILGGINWIIEVNQDISSARASIEVVNLTQKLDAVAHHHAVERGLSAGFLGSHGKKNQNKIQLQRKQADIAENNLKQAINSKYYALIDKVFLDKVTRAPLQQLSQKTKIRNQVDQLNGTGVFNYYSELNRRTLEGIQLLIYKVSNKKLVNQLNTLLTLLWIKERAGQSRGALNGIFSAQTTTGKRYAEIANFIQDEQHLFGALEKIADKDTNEQLRTIKQQKHWQSVNSVNAAFLGIDNYKTVKGPENWFALATQRITDIKLLSDKLGDSIVKSANLEARNLQLRCLITLILVGTFSLLVTLYLAIQYKHVLQRTNRTKRFMQDAAESQDYSKRINDNSKDEIGSIGRSFDRFLNTTTSILQNIQNTAESVTVAAEQLNLNTQHTLDFSFEQKKKTELIATAVNEMTYTSKDISGHIQSAAEKSRKVKEWADSSAEGIKSGKQSMDKLTNEIENTDAILQALVGNSQNIQGLLDTIQGIAEQTNLLALNAAIEAARAGEQGRGFAVVADEVRNLAKRTHDSTEEIHQLLSDLHNNSHAALKQMETSKKLSGDTHEIIRHNAENLEQLRHLMEDMDNIIVQVATGADQQTSVSEDINANVTNIADLAGTSLEKTQQSSEAINDLNSQFQEIAKKLQVFRL